MYPERNYLSPMLVFKLTQNEEETEMKSKAVLLLAVMALGGVLAGCAAPGAAGQPEDEATPTQEPTVEATEDPTEAPTIDPAGGIMPAETDEPGSTPEEAPIDIVATLQAADASVEVLGEVEQPFMSVVGTSLRVNGADVQAFEFESVEAAQAAAAALPADGSSFETLIIDWMDVPHFYQYEQFVVLYVGSDQLTLDLLTMLLGEQVAGG
jgi:hypothetical protein